VRGVKQGMGERTGTKMGWSWDCRKEGCCLEASSESQHPSKQQEFFIIIIKAAHIAAASALGAHLGLRLPFLWSFPKTTLGPRSSHGQSEC